VQPPSPGEAPSGLCECGCGATTSIAAYTDRGRRYFKGYPVPRLPGHGDQGRGKDSHSWRGGVVRTSTGYVLEHRPDHPHADSYGYVRQHRLVVEQTIGRVLLPTEHVHHINGIKDDNRPENLIALTKAAHNAEHAGNRKYTASVQRAAGLKGASARWGKTYT
jgi:hypothetical protein